MKEKTNKRSKFDTVINVFAWISFVLAFFVVGLCVFSSFSSEQNGKEIFGVKLLIVNSDSMSKSDLSQDEEIFFNVGDVVVVKKIDDISALKVGDVITFISSNKDSYGKTLTHKIREIKYTKEGRLAGYVTYGINTGESDQALATPDKVLGVYSKKLIKIGKVFNFMKTPKGYFISILTPCVLLIIFFSVKVGKFIGSKKSNEEYDTEIEALKNKIKDLENKENNIKNNSTNAKTS